MRDIDNKVYRLLTYGIIDLILCFKKAIVALLLYTVWVIFISDIRRIVILVILWISLGLLIYYFDRNRIVYVPPKPRVRAKKEKVDTSKEVKKSLSASTFIMDVDASSFNQFTFNDYVVDTFKKQDTTQIIDLMADRNKFIMEELKG